MQRECMQIVTFYLGEAKMPIICQQEKNKLKVNLEIICVPLVSCSS